MTILKNDMRYIRNSDDIVLIRQVVREWALMIQFSLVDQTKIVTASSELARNAVEYGGGGVLYLQIVSDGIRKGLKLIFEDKGPGIADIGLALKDGYTTGEGMGLGLGGARRLVNEFNIESSVGQGTKITIIRWK
ncbi:MAG: anti-sigma regulatory factor [Bacteroidota bacterium]|nr:anti-sigma regulatory factor [Bacteroidota bacterium]MDP4190558.1 anti-sigma regulatory factor [Bacteroidota bacterium]MDP4194218.1 anti-sigma regulatory factor [Bacteroidota bacterium]